MSDYYMSSHLSVCRVGIYRSAWHDSHVIQLWPCLLLLTKLRQIVSKSDSFCCTDLRDPFRSHSCQSDVAFTIFPSVIRRRAISMLLTPGNSLFNFGDWFVGAKGQARANPDYYCLSFRDLQKKKASFVASDPSFAENCAIVLHEMLGTYFFSSVVLLLRFNRPSVPFSSTTNFLYFGVCFL